MGLIGENPEVCKVEAYGFDIFLYNWDDYQYDRYFFHLMLTSSMISFMINDVIFLGWRRTGYRVVFSNTDQVSSYDKFILFWVNFSPSEICLIYSINGVCISTALFCIFIVYFYFDQCCWSLLNNFDPYYSAPRFCQLGSVHPP